MIRSAQLPRFQINPINQVRNVSNLSFQALQQIMHADEALDLEPGTKIELDRAFKPDDRVKGVLAEKPEVIASGHILKVRYTRSLEMPIEGTRIDQKHLKMTANLETGRRNIGSTKTATKLEPGTEITIKNENHRDEPFESGIITETPTIEGENLILTFEQKHLLALFLAGGIDTRNTLWADI